jgi:hypothetical protein
MPRAFVRTLGAATAAAITVVPLLTAAPAGATARPAPRHTAAVDLGGLLGNVAGVYAEVDGVDGRTLRTMRAAASDLMTDLNSELGAGFMTVSGLSDRNRDGRDDDGAMRVRILENVATVTLHRDRTSTVADAGFLFTNRRAVLKESAQSFDRALRLVAGFPGGADTWDVELIRELKAEMPSGVRVVSDHDGNHDGYDDDGRLTFLAGGKAVTLTIGNTARQVGRISYGPTWKTRAPKRVHHPVVPPSGGLGSVQPLLRSLPSVQRLTRSLTRS